MGNIHLVTGHAGEAHITAADHGSLYAAIFGSGQYVLDRGKKCAASIISNNSIRIADGDILMQGRHIRLNEGDYVDLTIENGEQGMLRHDLIVCRYTMNSQTGVEETNLVVIKGASAASNPQDPAYTSGNIMTGNALLADFPLYRVPLDGLNIQELVPLFDIGYVKFELKDKSVTSDKLANYAVKTGNLDTYAVTSLKIADKTVGTSKLADYSVTEEKLAGGSVTSYKIADAAVTPAKLSKAYVPEAGGTMTGALVAVAGAIGTKQMRNVYFGTTEKTEGAASSDPEGTMYFTIEE